MRYNDKEHDRKLVAIEKHLGPDALDTPESAKAEEEGENAMIRHVNKVYKSIKEHQLPHWKQD
jgi:hypothetical protein